MIHLTDNQSWELAQHGEVGAVDQMPDIVESDDLISTYRIEDSLVMWKLVVTKFFACATPVFKVALFLIMAPVNQQVNNLPVSRLRIQNVVKFFNILVVCVTKFVPIYKDAVIFSNDVNNLKISISMGKIIKIVIERDMEGSPKIVLSFETLVKLIQNTGVELAKNHKELKIATRIISNLIGDIQYEVDANLRKGCKKCNLGHVSVREELLACNPKNCNNNNNNNNFLPAPLSPELRHICDDVKKIYYQTTVRVNNLQQICNKNYTSNAVVFNYMSILISYIKSPIPMTSLCSLIYLSYVFPRLVEESEDNSQT